MSGFEIVSAAGPRRFTGSRAPDPGAPPQATRRGEPGRRGFDALCDVLLSPEGEHAAEHAPPHAAPPETIRGLYVLAMAGVEPAARRQTALAVAHELAPRSAPAAVFLFENGRADAHLLGEPACGRLGPQSYLASADMGENAARLAGRCDQVGLAILDGVTAIPADLAPAVRSAVFVATPDAESLVETYRGLKTWHLRGGSPEPPRSLAAPACPERCVARPVLPGRASPPFTSVLFIVCSDAGQEVRWFHDRLSRAARRFLDCDVAIQGFFAGASGAAMPNEPLRLFAGAPSGRVWSGLLAAAERGNLRPSEEAPAAAREASPQAVSSSAAIRVWEPTDGEALLSAIEVQVPALLGERCRLVLRVDVDEPDAPPLAAVRDDGALVAILIADGRRPADARAAEHWLAAHRSLLARAYPSAGIRADAPPSAVVLAPLEPAAAVDGLRRFLPVRLGVRRGVVIIPRAG